MLTLQLSKQAAHDLANIADFTLQRFGPEQAEHYYQKLTSLFETLCQFPQLGSDYSMLRSNTRRFMHESHCIYYQAHAKKLLILRVLSRWQDPMHQFE